MSVALKPYEVGEPLPARLDITWMRRIFHHHGRCISASQFHRLERTGAFRRFELTPQIGAKAWSGLRVARYLTGDSFAIQVKRSA